MANTTSTAPASAQGGYIEEKGKARTAGWALFDVLVHGGVGYGMNIFLALLTANDSWHYKRNQAIDAGTLNEEKTTTWFGWLHKAADKIETSKHVGIAADWMAQGIKDEKNKNFVTQQIKEITSGVFVLSAGGHLTTFLTGLIDSASVKPGAVRFLDNKIMDPLRKLVGRGPSAHDLHEREIIYDKMDNEFAGKSEAGMWGSRAAGLGAVIGSMVVLGQADMALTGHKPNKDTGQLPPESNLGFGRFPQAMRALTAGKKIEPVWLYKDKLNSEFRVGEQQMDKTQYMMRMTALEVIGSTMSQIIQYTYLMAQEFFGVGPHTSSQQRKPTEKKVMAAVETLASAPSLPGQTPQAQTSSPHTPRAGAEGPVAPAERVQKRQSSYAGEHRQQQAAMEHAVPGLSA